VFKHALRNSIIPIVTLLASLFPAMLGGSVIVESIFSIPGMGKLVVLKHDNGFITVYAHNRNILVKEKQAVARGQKIAELGSTDSERPKLHFQIRKGAAAVDPLLYLPK